jgi:tetratricopeptide (TPR) repeat protein
MPLRLGSERVPRVQERSAPRSLLLVAGSAAVTWFAVALLRSLTQMADRDLGFHIAWGRILLHDFAGARTLFLGQDPSVAVYAYSYWLYQLTVVALLDHLGPWGLVLFRATMVLGMLAVAFHLAGRLGASLWARSLVLAFAILAAQERFVDRPDVFSHLAWIVTLWILALHRTGRGVWLLVPLMVLWVNTHHYFSLLLALLGAYVAGDALEGKIDWRRSGMLFGSVILSTFLDPAGPGVWESQLKLLGALGGAVAPLPVQELIGPYADYNPTLSIWVFRIGMPVCLLVTIAARKRLGAGAVLALLGTALLAVHARRAISLFAITAAGLVPVALDQVVDKLPARGARLLRLASATAAALLGLLGVVALLNGRFFLAEDKDLRVGAVGPPSFPATKAAQFLRTWDIRGPILHDPVSAGAILMENGARLDLFLDPRWCGKAETNRAYVALSSATDSNIAGVWEDVQGSRGFETVMLDSYGMPALLRYLATRADWPLVFRDDRIAVFCQRGGMNASAIAETEPIAAATRARPDTAREAELARQVLRFLASRKPSPFARLEFPTRSFESANLALQLRDRPGAQTAYLELLRREAGSLHLSRHRLDVLENTLWCLATSREWESRAALCAALIQDPETPAERRRGLRVEDGLALLRLGRAQEAEQVAATITADPAATAEDRWWAWSCSAGARLMRDDNEGAIQALRAAARARPDAAETYRSIAVILDSRLGRGADALEAYETYLSLAGKDSQIEERVRQLKAQGASR